MNNQIPDGSELDKCVQPCQIGDIVYVIGKSVFLSKEDAEKVHREVFGKDDK